MANADHKARVLFLCTGNSCRSQMAEGWARALRSREIEAYSAGTDPQGLNPLAVRAMAEAGIDISRHTSKRPEALGVEFDFVVTVCDSAHGWCPLFPARTRVVRAAFDDPPRLALSAVSDEAAMPHYRRVRDEIREFVLTLPGALTPPLPSLCKETPMPTIKVFDPPMCCASGVCGSEPDVSLARFAADLQWLRTQGVEVERFTLSQQPDRFTSEPMIMSALSAGGTSALPIVMQDDRIIAERAYPTREALAASLGLTSPGAAPSDRAGGCCCKPGRCC